MALGATITAMVFRSQARNEYVLRSEAVENLYFSCISDAQHELESNNLRHALELLKECPEHLQDWEWSYLNRRCQIEPAVLPGPVQGMHSVTFSGDGTKLAAAGGDGSILIFDVNTGDKEEIKAHSDKVFSVAFHPDGNLLASAGADKNVKVWDLARERPLFEKSGRAGNFAGLAYALAFSHDGKRLAYGSDEQTIRVCTVPSGQRVFDLPGHKRLATAVAFNPDDTLMATGSFSGEVAIWDARTGAICQRLAAAHHPIGAVAFSPDGRLLATASFDRLIKIWDTTTWHVVQTLRGHWGLIVGLAFSPDGQRLASSGEDKTVRLWHPRTGREILTIRDHTRFCTCVVFNAKGQLAACSLDGTARVYDPATPEANERLWSWTREHDDEVWQVAFRGDGRQLASVAWDKTVRLWDPVDGRPQHILSQPEAVMSLAYFPDGKYLAVNGGSPGSMTQRITIWDCATGRQSGPSLEGVGLVYAVNVSPDNGHVLAEDTSGKIGIWNVRTRQYERSYDGPGQHVWCLQFSPDGQRFLSAGNTFGVQLWPWHADRFPELKTPLQEFPEAWVVGFSNRATFSYDGQRLITGGREHTVKIWDANNGQLLSTLFGHTGDVFAVAVSPDGRWLASGGEDTTIRLWDAETGKTRYELRGHLGVINSVAFSPDSRRLASGSRDHSVKVWELDRIAAKGQ